MMSKFCVVASCNWKTVKTLDGMEHVDFRYFDEIDSISDET